MPDLALTQPPTLFAISLIATELTYNVEVPEADEAEFNISVGISEPTSVEDDTFVFRAVIDVTKRPHGSEKDLAGFEAVYMCAINWSAGSASSLFDVAKGFTTTSIWSLYSSLFAVVVQQIGVEFPTLPTFPKNVAIIEANSDPS